MSELKCTYKDLLHTKKSLEFLCKEGSKICFEKQEMFNFFQLYWCGFEGNNILLILFYIIGIFLIFKYTSITVDEYIAEGITKISDYLKFSEALSAVTLLAFSNGAGDLITALVASGTEGGISYNIGALFGAGMFVCSIVVSICVFQCEGDIVFDKMIIYRDVGIYILAVIATIIFAFYGEITWWTSSILLGLYLLLVIVVLVEERYFTSDGGNDLEDPDNEELTTLVEIGGSQVKKGKEFLASVVASEKFQKYKKKLRREGLLDMSENHHSGIYENAFGDNKHSLNRFLSIVRQVKYGLYVRKKTHMMIEHRNRPYDEKSCLDLVIETFEYPFFFLLYLTALPTDEENYSKLRCMVYSIPGTLFMWYVFHPILDSSYVYYALPLGFTVFILFAYTLPEDNKPPKWFILISLLGVISGLMWTYLLIGYLIDMLELLGVVLNLEETYLGLTILAIGNALPDALTTISLCKEGAGVLAISGGYAGQLFGYLVGFGVSMLKLTWKKGPQKFDLFDMAKIRQNVLDLAVIFIIFLTLVYTFTTGILNKFRMNNLFATNLAIFYGAFIIFSTVIAIKNSMNVS